MAFGLGKLGPPELGLVGRGHPTAADPPSARSRLHSNHLFCDCHLAWLSQWLRQRPTIGLFTQCAAPAQLRGLNVAEIQKNEFSCSGEGVGEAAGTGAGIWTGGTKSAPWIQPTSAAWAQMRATGSSPGVGTPRGHLHPVAVTRGCKSVPAELRAFCTGLGHSGTLCTRSSVPPGSLPGAVPPSCPSPLQSPCWPLPRQDKRRRHVPSSAACPPAPARPCALAATASWTVGARG